VKGHEPIVGFVLMLISVLIIAAIVWLAVDNT